MREVEKQADGIELLALDVHAHAIVVAVRILALALVAAQGVSGRKCLFHADLKHSLFG